METAKVLKLEEFEEFAFEIDRTTMLIGYLQVYPLESVSIISIGYTPVGVDEEGLIYISPLEQVTKGEAVPKDEEILTDKDEVVSEVVGKVYFSD